MRDTLELPASLWSAPGCQESDGGPFPAWHPRTLRAGAAALGATASVLLRLRWANEPSLALSRWSQELLRALRVEVHLASPIPEGAPLWVANHLSWLDPMVLLARRPMGTLAKREVADYPVLGPQVRRAGLLLVDRKDPVDRAAALAAMLARWRQGAPFLLFPEGTTTCGGRLAPLHEGGLRAAYRMGIPVLPLRIDSPDPHYPWIGEESLLPHLNALCRARRTLVRLLPGEVLRPDGNEETWLRAVRDQLESLPK